MEKEKKAQIQTGETIAVVIIIVIMIFIGLWIYFSKSVVDVGKEDESQAELERITTAIVSSALEELKCTSYSDFSSSCLDYYRIRALANLTKIEKYGKSYTHYYSKFRKSRIAVHVIYPESATEPSEYIIYEYNGTSNTSVPIFMPVLLYDPVYRENHFGMIEVRTFKE